MLFEMGRWKVSIGSWAWYEDLESFLPTCVPTCVADISGKSIIFVT